ncbi:MULTISPECIES: pyruvate, phosphate dikinase [Dehalobacter]|jgi:pyruvate,orthophosphate dikinase|uniref:Pyruvate, phosphate dikinase n=2 Tax=Dehalobacter restrictus TaxID=55583 RepID=A0A857DGC1_9FIRM|nr:MULTISPECIES: pyruvate, phosphate dikinase [Dehalobacter]AHF09224.1 pyruvate phosphate dikinase [Dehalobacter restrictus DSM 9455]MCG1025773.1 pyruvate, phosphate dikinase [Dehalobacter sp.]MDJ0306397.1 pyruvate, phosphate dikinase [Dehalobacter sp.]OCZ51415.1 pyruvate, phosphate dikinase [Dehalobacter sp. TeCB1]QGZ99760.1 pyruvate, phosphate dikinase [Dehalobacter restrictus]
MVDKKYVYLFREGSADMKNLLGGKGANLAEMTNIGLNVPQGFTITTEACLEYYDCGEQLPGGLWEQILPAIQDVERASGKRFGDPENPLLVSVRSGARVSMPGMMDTILNLGLNEGTASGVSKATGNERFAFDCYRRFIQMFGDVVLGIASHKFENILEEVKEKQGVTFDSELSPESLKGLVVKFKALVKQETGVPFPDDPYEQLKEAITAVFKSWNNHRAIVYRKANGIPDSYGTAVNVQSMVFGNMGNDSGTGVAFTRNPSTGEKHLYGEYLMNAQGEDVVAGIRTPLSIDSLQNDNPEIYRQFSEIAKNLENHYKNMQDIEFTIEKGRLYILQTRNGKCTISAAIRIAVELCQEGLITKEEAVERIDPHQLEKLLHRRIDDAAKLDVVATGLPASPGAASGKIIFSADEAEKLGQAGEKVILVGTETTPDDIHGMLAAQGILTSRGGMTSHAAVVARHMGKPAVCGCDALKINLADKIFMIGDDAYPEGTEITIDGATGRVIRGTVPMKDPDLSGEFQKILEWSDGIRKLQVMANADNPPDAAKAREFGAQGIGLCRTEHMFMDPARIPIVQKMILAQTLPEREAALAELLPMQEGDFYGILKAMHGLPVTIRLLDPPLHEFLPNGEELALEIQELKLTANLQDEKVQKEIKDKEVLLKKVRGLQEMNPMLGHRGCRLGISYPEIYAMQSRAIFKAAARLVKEGVDVRPHVKIPLVIHHKELEILRKQTEEIAQEIIKTEGVKINYQIGTMIEVPRAALTADEIAPFAEFFSFGTNDLTQTVLGFSRDDAEGKFLPDYLNQNILANNPFAVLDRDGVGRIMKICVDLGRKANPGIKIGICGEHGGDPSSIEFCQEINLDYVSCSPFRVPIARLGAAQAALKNRA